MGKTQAKDTGQAQAELLVGRAVHLHLKFMIRLKPNLLCLLYRQANRRSNKNARRSYVG